MTPEEWQRVRRVYERLAAADPSGRDVILAEECDGDLELESHVRGMLAADEAGDTLVEVVARAANGLLGLEEGAEGCTDPLALVDPVSIDRYRIEGRVGEGGMGVVYAAVRRDGLLQTRFALKVLRRGMDSESFVRRFAAERSALERLDHPNVARLLDAGTCGDGRPYLVMELVDGVPIDAWCRARNPSLRERLTRFAEVCDAVAYAHSRLVIHRDLKPSNILVGASGTTKLLDFGIARIIESDGEGHAAVSVTATRERILTPRYASPELLRGEPVSTASDVYSLGVVLYELLTCGEPYSVAERTYAGYDRAVREQTPPRPSAAVSAGAAALRTHAVPSKLLRGDLDTIVAKAMRKEPDRRYESAAALAADLRAFLDSRPIAARAESLGYELRTLVRRHRWQAAAAAAALAGVLGLSIVALLLAQRALNAEARAESALDDAQLQSAISQRYGEFLTEEFLLLLDPARSMNGTITLEEAVRRAADRVEGRFPESPLSEALIEQTFGDAFIQRSRYAEAEEHLRRAWRLREAELGPDHLDTLISKRDLATSLLGLGRREEARDLLTEVVAVQKRTLDADDGLTLLSASILGRVLGELGDDDAAEALLLQTYEARRRTLGPRDGNTISSMNQLGVFYMQRERFADALPHIEEAETLRRAEYGDEHPRTLVARGNLATLRGRLGDHDRAVADLRAVREIQLRVLGPDHGHTLHVLAQIADLERTRGAIDAAIDARRDHTAALATARGPDASAVLESRMVLIELLLAHGRESEAVAELDELRAAAARSTDLPESLRERIEKLEK